MHGREGLDDDALRRVVLPSGWCCLQLVQHLALDDERFWFRGVVAGDQGVIDDVLASGDDGWSLAPGTSSATVLERYRAESAASDTIIATTPLDAPPAWWPEDVFGDFRMDTVREVVLHVLTETAVHAGHLDAARELIDGRRWLVLD